MDKINTIMKKNRIRKKIILLAVLIITITIASTLIYVYVYEKSKPLTFPVQIERGILSAELTNLKSVKEANEFEFIINNTARVVVQYTPTELKEFDSQYENGYSVCKLPEAEIQYDDWFYARIEDVYSLITGNLGNYSSLFNYHNSSTKNPPRYRYKININILKDGSLYKLHIFCKDPKYLYEVISQTVLEINQSV